MLNRPEHSEFLGVQEETSPKPPDIDLSAPSPIVEVPPPVASKCEPQAPAQSKADATKAKEGDAAATTQKVVSSVQFGRDSEREFTDDNDHLPESLPATNGDHDRPEVREKDELEGRSSKFLAVYQAIRKSSSNLRSRNKSHPGAGVQSATGMTKVPTARRVKKKPSGNTNTPQDYLWLQALLNDLGTNKANTLGCHDVASKSIFTPLFLLIGPAPSILAPMQAIVFACDEKEHDLDFWYVKPRKGQETELESQTLHRQTKGAHKNDPGASKRVLQPFAELFVAGWQTSARKGGPKRRFYVETPDSCSCPRAVLEEDFEDEPKMYLTFIWMEDWSSPLSWHKFVSGKLVYQRDPQVAVYQARQFKLVDKDIHVSEFEEGPWTTPLPPESLKDLYKEFF
jgi:hypothetical protein